MKIRISKMSSLPVFFLSAATVFASEGGNVPEDAVSQKATGTRAVFSVLDDNDFFGKWSDKYYTNHSRFALTLGSEVVEDSHGAYFFSFGQEMYTPKNYDIPVPDSRDRPYAGYLYGSFGEMGFDEKAAIMRELQIGVTGDWSFAGETQSEYHRHSGDPIPQGWDSQIHNRLVVQYMSELRVRFPVSGTIGSGDYASDLIFREFGNLGNLRGNFALGGQFRYGWNLPKDFGYAPMRQSSSAVFDPQVDASIYAFIDFQAEAVLWDKTLTSNNGRGANINPYPFVGELAVGVSAIYDRYMLTFFQAVRTKDFSTQDKDFFAYGGFKISVCF